MFLIKHKKRKGERSQEKFKVIIRTIHNLKEDQENSKKELGERYQSKEEMDFS